MFKFQELMHYIQATLSTILGERVKFLKTHNLVSLRHTLIQFVRERPGHDVSASTPYLINNLDGDCVCLSVGLTAEM